MKKVSIITSFSLLFVTFEYVICATIIKESECKRYPCLIFKDDFDNFDFSTWKHHKSAALTGNKEFQYYTNNRTNSFVRDGVLYLKPTLTNDTYDDKFLTSGTLDLWGDGNDVCTSNRGNYGCYRKGTNEEIINPIQSAAVTTMDSFSFKYGKMEVNAKLPEGDWLWPAIWLMPKYSAYGRWPACGEIDLMESRGNSNLKDEKGTPVGFQRVMQSLHWGPYFSLDRHSLTAARTNKQGGSFADNFHRFSFVWDPDSITFYVDNKKTFQVNITEGGFWQLGFSNVSDKINNPWISGTKLAPFDQEFYIIMNVAVGGTIRYFEKQYSPKMPWSNGDGLKAMKDFWEARDQWLPTWKGDNTALKIDYIKVWKMNDY